MDNSFGDCVRQLGTICHMEPYILLKRGTAFSPVDLSDSPYPTPTHLIGWNILARRLADKNRGRIFRLVWQYTDPQTQQCMTACTHWWYDWKQRRVSMQVVDDCQDVLGVPAG